MAVPIIMGSLSSPLTTTCKVQREIYFTTKTGDPIIATAIQTSNNRSLTLALTAARIVEENHGRDIVILDLRKVTPEFDYFVVATGTSRRQLHAAGEEILQIFKHELGERRMGVEGLDASSWILLDYGNVVIHLFDEEKRAYYDLENLWSAAQRVPWNGEDQTTEVSSTEDETTEN